MKKYKVSEKIISFILCLSMVAGFFSDTFSVKAATNGVSYDNGNISTTSEHDTATPTGWRYTTVGLVLHKSKITDGNVGSELKFSNAY